MGRLVVAGDGPLRPELESLALELDVCDRVLFLGRQSRAQVATLMRRAKCLVLPSSSEGYPLVVAEALASGTPVVASRVGGIAEMLTSDAAGELVESGDVAGLAKALVRVVASERDPHAVAAANGARPWSDQARLLANLYGRCVGYASDILPPS